MRNNLNSICYPKMPFENLLNISVKKDYIDYLSALLTPTVAIAGLYLAVNHKRIEEARLRHELFERRYRQFKAVERFVLLIMVHDDMKNEDEMTFLSEIAGMSFIFDKEIDDYVQQNIWQLANSLHTLQSEFKEIPPSEERSKNAREQGEIEKKLQKNLDTFKKKTLKYMQLQQTGIVKYLLQYLATLWEKIKKSGRSA